MPAITFSREDDAGKFFAYLLLFQGAMLGIVLSDNILLLVVFWELTSLSSFLLIGFWSHKADGRQGARMALVVTGAGGLALLGGMVLLGEAAGSYALTDILHRGDVVRASPLYPAILTLVLVGAFTKSAQFPFHFWLPHAMAAPTPVSAYLHSATMVKAGIFLMARLWPVLGGTEAWFISSTGTGLVTMLVGAWIALFKDDLKGILAHSTVSHLGLMTMLLGIGTPYAATAAVFHILNHAIFKAALFMSAGIVDHETHTRDIRSLGGLVRRDANQRHPGSHRQRGDGRRAALQRLPVEGNDARSRAPDQLCRVDDGARRAGHGRRVALGGLLSALRRRSLPWPVEGRATGGCPPARPTSGALAACCEPGVPGGCHRRFSAAAGRRPRRANGASSRWQPSNP